jgi:KaiC/GvpD/RAD55 family RecA-like ATPase
MGSTGFRHDHSHHHAVQFYSTDQSLIRTVAGFLSEGLAAGQPALVVATPAHRVAIAEALMRRGADPQQALRTGDLIVLDAEATLDLFIVDGAPDPALFEENVGRLVEQALNGRDTVVVRAYGEMVDVLWKQGRPDAAIQLEMLWNKLARKYSFALLCGYAMGSFYKQTHRLDEVIAQHTTVIPHDTDAGRFAALRR